MNSIQLGWIDYSSEHRNKVMAVLNALSAPGAVDELGIGQIRDGFANRIFPGTSTIQTRAKYFFIVPYILMELEKEKNLAPKAMMQKLGEMELDLIDPLKASGEKGVVGATSGRKLKRKPSSIYWNGLRTFGMFRYRYLSLDDYLRAVNAINKELTTHKAMGKRMIDDQQNDDSDACQSVLAGGFWCCLPPKEGWRSDINIQLSPEEALYLKERICKSPYSKGSLFAFLLCSDPEKVLEINNFAALGEVFDIPDTMREDYDRAVRFSDFIFGANIRYNIIISEGNNTAALDKWDAWQQSPFVVNDFSRYDCNEAMDYLKINNYRLRRFLRDWQNTVVSGDNDAIDELIVKREIEIKSSARAKLRNPSIYVYQEGEGMRGGKLDYRYWNAMAIIEDIFKGMENKYAETGR